MSKVAGTIEGTDRAALEAFVQSGDTSVPGVEMSDLNDGDILARTRENVNPNGLFQFVYIPDDGSENITSDWVDQEHKKKLVRQWVDGVKGNIIARANETINAAKEKAIEDRARAIRDEQFEAAPAGPALREAVRPNDPRAPAQSIPARSIVQSSDPTQYIEDQLETARERLRAAETMQQDVMREVLSTRRDYEKWKALAAALGGVGDNDSVSAGTSQQAGAGGKILRDTRPSGSLRNGTNIQR